MSQTLFNVFGAASSSSGSSSGSSIFSLLPLVFIFVAMYFLLLKPQRKRQKESRALQSTLGDGDEVILNSGIYGFVSSVEDDYLWLDIAEQSPGKSIEIRVARSAVARVVNKASDPQTPGSN
ncbi:MAG: preprotein translocase subunit YajC [Actinomycetota bacterium]